MKNVLVLVYDDPGQEARLQAALDIARALDGHLHCLDVSLMPQSTTVPYEGLLLGEIVEDEVKRETANKHRLQERLSREDVPFSWADTTDRFEHAIEDAAGLADLIVINRQLSSPSFLDMRRTASGLVVHLRRPIVAVPEDVRGFDVFGHALIAWDGSPSASAAMIAAAPLLKLAATVTLLEIDDGSIDTPAEAAAAYLGRYDVHPRIVREDAMGRPAGEILLAAVKAQAANYVVMGGYGRNRTIEAIFGGATRTLLSASPIPVFLAH